MLRKEEVAFVKAVSKFQGLSRPPQGAEVVPYVTQEEEDYVVCWDPQHYTWNGGQIPPASGQTKGLRAISLGRIIRARIQAHST
jgi:hypothetical protein